ncbi:hypothetical protein [Azospirillum sp. Sh1]|uniref:hypothetical protein n=1 Tax=Azospirillum sp. Sh1 TaxID=2607285 RepID=UPI0011EF5AF2|nr:hypothetical protein [Azospirillum sp. Sh1]KAA0577670.1 hypothetical protein FZ029_11005 [Azospirillum sp. Sh1]
MTEEQQFITRFEKACASGLVDMKFMVCEGDTLSREDFFGALNRIDAAIDAGRCVRHDAWEDVACQPSELLYA